jgi:hypothetical protein
MRSSLRLPAGRIGVALICLMVMIQTGCTGLQLSPSLAPGSGGTDPGTDPGGGTGKSSTGNIVGIATLAAVGGYILYKLVIEDDEENTVQELPEVTPQVRDTVPPHFSRPWFSTASPETWKAPSRTDLRSSTWRRPWESKSSFRCSVSFP